MPLLPIIENGLHPQAKFLYTILHAYADQNGVAIVAEDQIAAIMRISPSRLRGYRSAINQSGYATVSLSNGNLIFTAESDHQARDIARGARDSDREPSTGEPPADESTRDIARSTRDIARGARDIARGARAGGDNRGGKNERTSFPPLSEKNSFIHSFSEAEQNASLALLTDPAVQMGLPNAHKWASARPFEEIRAFACKFVAQGRIPDTDAGLIDYWLRSGEPVPPLSHNELWQRHRTAQEIAEDEKRQAQAAEDNRRWEAEEAERQAQRDAAQSAPSPTPASQPVAGDIRQSEPDEIWAQVLSELAATLPAATYEQWVRDTDALSHADGEFVVGVPHAYARDWLKDRLRFQVKRSLARLLQQSVEVTFAVRPRPTTPGGHL